MPYLFLTFIGEGSNPATIGTAVFDPCFVVGIETTESGRIVERYVPVTRGTGSTRVGSNVARRMAIGNGRDVKLKLLCVDLDGEAHEFPMTVHAKPVYEGKLNPDYFELGWDQLFDKFEAPDNLNDEESPDMVLVAKAEHQVQCVKRPNHPDIV